MASEKRSMNSQTVLAPRSSELYNFLDQDMNLRTGAAIGFNNLLVSSPYPMSDDVLQGFRERYQRIKQFQETTLSLFNASLHGNADPELAELVLGEVPTYFAHPYHRRLTERQARTPVFFRTDEVVPGKLSEIQCCGSGWGLHDQIHDLYQQFEVTFKPVGRLPRPLSAQFPQVLRHYLGRDPIIHHLVDNASLPHDARYFVSRTREHGVQYFSYDNVRPEECNFVRSHDFVSLFHNNFAKSRLEACEAGDCFFDLPPMILFDGKIILALPFWHKTRQYYDDRVRDLLPYTQIITPDGFDLPDGSWISPADFCDRPQSKRKYYIKYAGTDVALNWGSKSVYYAASLSAVKCRELLSRVEADYAQKRYWIIQEAHRCPESISVMTRDNTKVDLESYAKISGFYGPNGLMGILVMHKRFHKVHGSPDTALSIVT